MAIGMMTFLATGRQSALFSLIPRRPTISTFFLGRFYLMLWVDGLLQRVNGDFALTGREKDNVGDRCGGNFISV